MKIIKLTSENVKCLKAISIEPDGNLVIIGGKNGAGKTSALDSIAFALGGKGLCPEVPIRTGQKTAKAEVALDNGMVVTRTFTAGGSKLTVTSSDGAKYPSPQKMLDALVGELAFDPLAFSRMKPADQRRTLMALVGLDMTAIDAERQQVYAERTEVNRDVKKARAQFAGLTWHKDVPADEVAVSDLVDEHRRRLDHNANNFKRAEQSAVMRADAVALAEEIVAAKAVVAGLQTQLEHKWEAGKKLAERVAAAIDEDLDEIKAQIDNAEETNSKVRENHAYTKREGCVSGLEIEAKRLTDRIAEIETCRLSSMTTAAYPVRGLAVSDNGAVLNDLPFDQASSAERLRCSVAIGLALNPELRVLLVRDGSLLDEDSMRLIGEMAAEADGQLWIETISTGAECSVVIEDGELRK